MKANITAETLVEMNESSLTPNLPTQVRYVVSHSSGDIDTMEFIHWRSVVNYLSDDDQISQLAYQDYMSHLDGAYNEELLAEWVEMYLTEFADQAGYTIVRLK